MSCYVLEQHVRFLQYVKYLKVYKMGEIIDKLKDKAKGVKDKVVDTTKDVAEKTKKTVDSSVKTPSSTNGREYEEGAAGTNKNLKSDPLTEYTDTLILLFPA